MKGENVRKILRPILRCGRGVNTQVFSCVVFSRMRASNFQNQLMQNTHSILNGLIMHFVNISTVGIKAFM